MNARLRRWYQRFRDQQTGSRVGHDAEDCLALARAQVWLGDHNAYVAWGREDVSIRDAVDDDETIRLVESGKLQHLCAVLRVDGVMEASLGSVIVENDGDPYCRQVEAELVLEYLATKPYARRAAEVCAAALDALHGDHGFDPHLAGAASDALGAMLHNYWSHA